MFITQHIRQEANVKAWNGFLSILYLNVVFFFFVAVVVVVVVVVPIIGCKRAATRFAYVVAFCPE